MNAEKSLPIQKSSALAHPDENLFAAMTNLISKTESPSLVNGNANTRIEQLSALESQLDVVRNQILEAKNHAIEENKALHQNEIRVEQLDLRKNPDFLIASHEIEKLQLLSTTTTTRMKDVIDILNSHADRFAALEFQIQEIG